MEQQAKTYIKVRLSTPGMDIDHPWIQNHKNWLASGFTVRWHNLKLGLTPNWRDLLLASHLILSVMNRPMNAASIIKTPAIIQSAPKEVYCIRSFLFRTIFSIF